MSPTWKVERHSIPLMSSCQAYGAKGYQLDKYFREYHYSILDMIEEDEDFDREQVILDAHEEKISNILDCLYILLTPVQPTKGVVADPRHHINRHLAHVDNSLARISDEQKDVKSGPNIWTTAY